VCVDPDVPDQPRRGARSGFRSLVYGSDPSRRGSILLMAIFLLAINHVLAVRVWAAKHPMDPRRLYGIMKPFGRELMPEESVGCDLGIGHACVWQTPMRRRSPRLALRRRRQPRTVGNCRGRARPLLGARQRPMDRVRSLCCPHTDYAEAGGRNARPAEKTGISRGLLGRVAVTMSAAAFKALSDGSSLLEGATQLIDRLMVHAFGRKNLGARVDRRRP